MARLKTYTAELDGLNDWIVAAPNQNAALEAFGVHQNLFAQGLAGVTTEPALMEAAAKAPGQPLKRRKGGKGAFTAGPADSDWQAALKAAAVGGKKTPRKRASRAKLDKAEDALEAAQRNAAAVLGDLEAEIEAMTARLQRARAEQDRKIEKAKAAVDAAEAAYREAAG